VTIHNIGFNHTPFKQHARNAYMMVNTVQPINAFDIKENARKMEMCYLLLPPRTHLFPPRTWNWFWKYLLFTYHEVGKLIRYSPHHCAKSICKLLCVMTLGTSAHVLWY